MSNTGHSNLTSGFIDLATYDESEKYMYGGSKATTYFVSDVCKSTWFALVPCSLSSCSGVAGFNSTFSFSVSRAGDYCLQSWLRVTVPPINLVAPGTGVITALTSIRWVRNLLHNLCFSAALTFNDLKAEEIDSFQLDMWAAFTTPASKLNGYNNMIGNTAALNGTHMANGDIAVPEINAATLNLPLPFFYTRDTGVALPTAALPYNEIKIKLRTRNWTELLIVEETGATPADVTRRAPTTADFVTVPEIPNFQCWANYAVVSNDERKRMACAPRDILMEQMQRASTGVFNPSNNPTPTYDIRYSHAVKVLMFAVANTTAPADLSCYSTNLPFNNGVNLDFDPPGNVDTMATCSLIYENTSRLGDMSVDYYSTVQPWYHAPSIPELTGYHMYSYSLDFYKTNPMGSTNYGKLTNVSMRPAASARSIVMSNSALTGLMAAQTYRFDCACVNNNIIRISGGALGFPVL